MTPIVEAIVKRLVMFIGLLTLWTLAAAAVSIVADAPFSECFLGVAVGWLMADYVERKVA